MDLNLFKALEVVMRAYSRQAPKKLIDYYLRFRIVLKISFEAYKQLASQINLSSAEHAIFSSCKSKQFRYKQLVCLVVDHPLNLALSSLLLESLSECIVINEGGNCSNILGVVKGDINLPTKGVLLKINSADFEELTQNIDAYFSVCEVFMGHLHLTVSCFEALNNQVAKELEPVEGDEFADFREFGYFRMLEERASKISLEELSDTCRIERQRWGEMLVFEGGQECLIVWITFKRLPLLGQVPKVGLNRKRIGLMPLMVESELGFKIFKKKEYLKEKLQDLQTTTIIFNTKQCNEEVNRQIQLLFNRQVDTFFKMGYFQRDNCVFQENITLCERICQILDVPTVELLKKIV